MTTLRAPGAARRSAAVRAATQDAEQRRAQARAELAKGRLARLDIIDQDRAKMTPVEVRTATADLAQIMRNLILAT